MPTILRSNGFRFVIWPDDHAPPHVHIFKAGDELIIELGVEVSQPTIRNAYRMGTRDIALAFAITRVYNDIFLERWKEINTDEH